MDNYQFSKVYRASCVAYSPGSTFIATALLDKVSVRSTSSLECIRTWTCAAPDGPSTSSTPDVTVDRLDWSPSGGCLFAFSHARGLVWVFDLAQDHVVARVGGDILKAEWGQDDLLTETDRVRDRPVWANLPGHCAVQHDLGAQPLDPACARLATNVRRVSVLINRICLVARSKLPGCIRTTPREAIRGRVRQGVVGPSTRPPLASADGSTLKSCRLTRLKSAGAHAASGWPSLTGLSQYVWLSLSHRHRMCLTPSTLSTSTHPLVSMSAPLPQTSPPHPPMTRSSPSNVPPGHPTGDTLLLATLGAWFMSLKARTGSRSRACEVIRPCQSRNHVNDPGREDKQALCSVSGNNDLH
jgi:WD40 repeat protein